MGTSGARVVVAMVLLAALAVGPSITTAQAASPEPTPSARSSAWPSTRGPDPTVVAAQASFEAAIARQRAAQGAYADAQAGAAAADAALREAEEELVVVVLDHRDRARAARAAEGAAEDAVRVRDELRGELRSARDQLAERAREVYKYGSTAARIGDHMLEMLAELDAPLELGRGLYQLDAVVGHEHRTVGALEVETGLADAEAAKRLRTAGRARAAATAAEARAGEGEATVRQARAASHAAEATLLASWDELLAADQMQLEAQDGLLAAARAAHRGGTQGGATGDEAGDGRAETAAASGSDEIATRRRALQRARSLDPDESATRSDLVCPVDGAGFVNDWYFARSEGRRHEGNDLFAPTGSPIKAVTDGRVLELDQDEGDDLGGITVTYGQPHDRWYAAHLSQTREGLRAGDLIEAGDVIGYVGDTGNARGTPPHLHLGWYVDDVAVNPYVSLAVACAATRGPVPAGQGVAPAPDGPAVDGPPTGLRSACPVHGAVFVNDWHFPRSGGRLHQGNDLFAPAGTPIKAVVGGEILKLDPYEGGDLGGITVTYGHAGDRWYAAHLLAIATGLRPGDRIDAGDLIGYVGNSGNARTTPPHLHIGWYVDGVAVNPYHVLAPLCASAGRDPVGE